MKVYIASKYILHKEVNQKIHDVLVGGGIDVFLPESIQVDAVTLEENREVGDKCYNELKTSDAVIWVSPYGESVAAEIGAAIILNKTRKPIHIVLFGKQPKVEAMTTPYIDAIVDSEECRGEENYQELLRVVRSFQNEGKL